MGKLADYNVLFKIYDIPSKWGFSDSGKVQLFRTSFFTARISKGAPNNLTNHLLKKSKIINKNITVSKKEYNEY